MSLWLPPALALATSDVKPAEFTNANDPVLLKALDQLRETPKAKRKGGKR